MQRLLLWALAALLCLSVMPGTALAAKQAYTTTYRHAMGDDETRTEARRKCLAGAKRRILEQAGTFVSSSTTVENFELTNDQITEIAAGFMEVEVLDERTELEGDSLVISMTVKALLDPDEVRAGVTEAVAGAEADQADQEARISELERQLEEIRQQQEQAAAGADTEAGAATQADTAGDGGSAAGDMAWTLGRLLPEIAVRILAGMSSEKRGDVLRVMDPDARSRLQDQVSRQSSDIRISPQAAPALRKETVRTLPDPRRDPPRAAPRAVPRAVRRDRDDAERDRREQRDRGILYPWTPRDTGRSP